MATTVAPISSNLGKGPIADPAPYQRREQCKDSSQVVACMAGGGEDLSITQKSVVEGRGYCHTIMTT